MAKQTPNSGPSIDEEREQLYADAKALGLRWAAWRRRVYSVPAHEFTAEELAVVPEPTDEEIRADEIEDETISLLQQLADLFEGDARRGGDA